jgi:VWFA-related protein
MPTRRFGDFPLELTNHCLAAGLVIWLSLSCHPTLRAAQAAGKPARDQSAYTFQANTLVVLTDVTVTDPSGNPVGGLPQSAFHIFDNNQPQSITSFKEQDGIPAAIPSTNILGVYSNDYLMHPPSVLNIMLIDIANIRIADQMYLNEELTKFLIAQPEGQPLAIYLRAGSGCFLVQDFTSNRKLLLDALHKAIPRFPPLGAEYLSDFETLRQIAISLSELSGRKNVLWFSGGSTLFLKPDATPLQNDGRWRVLYDYLNLERIAIYPIDARGLEANSNQAMQLLRSRQHLAMSDAARATGGEAFYNDNGVKEIAEHLLNSDGSFYTLTFSPHNVSLDNKWHKIRVTVGASGYRLSYRRGYFADGSLRGRDRPAIPRTRLLANGETRQVVEQNSRPLIFEARVLPASGPAFANLEKPSGSLPPLPAKKGSVPFSIRFTLPIDSLSIRKVGGEHQIVIGIGAIALNREGSTVERNAEQVILALDENVSVRDPTGSITLDQQFNLAKNDKFLKLSVWDTISRRLGTIQIPIEVHKPSKRHASAEEN